METFIRRKKRTKLYGPSKDAITAALYSAVIGNSRKFVSLPSRVQRLH